MVAKGSVQHACTVIASCTLYAAQEGIAIGGKDGRATSWAG
jgi:hypothetical protein